MNVSQNERYSFSPNEVLMYLRKSRADNPAETVEEVLYKHYNILQDYALRELGFRVPEENIYREVVSGESISDRVEIKKVLSRCERKDIRAVLVVDPQRLSRGDLIDCGTLVNTFLYTDTLIITPTITYHLDNKMERRFFQDELMRGHDYLEYVKEILERGKLASIQRGAFIDARAPYGYDRVKRGRDYTLVANESAEVVRLIFELFLAGNTTWKIGKTLESMGIKSPSGRDDWQAGTIDKIIRNEHYAGKVVYGKSKTVTVYEDGQRITRRARVKDGYVVAEGQHEAIIDDETFEAAQKLIGQRPPLPADRALRNCFAGILHCDKCGAPLVHKVKGEQREYMVCKTPKCCKAVSYDILRERVANTLENVQLPQIVAKLESGEGDAREIREKLIKELERELDEAKAQEQKQYELLERGVYSEDIFFERNAAIHKRITELVDGIQEANRTMPDAVDYRAGLVTLAEAIDALRDKHAPTYEVNRFLRSIISDIRCESVQSCRRNEYILRLNITMLI